MGRDDDDVGVHVREFTEAVADGTAFGVTIAGERERDEHDEGLLPLEVVEADPVPPLVDEVEGRCGLSDDGWHDWLLGVVRRKLGTGAGYRGTDAVQTASPGPPDASPKVSSSRRTRAAHPMGSVSSESVGIESG